MNKLKLILEKIKKFFNQDKKFTAVEHFELKKEAQQSKKKKKK
jgi:hypothetical protein